MVTYRADIDGLRAIAILPVVLYHAGLPGLTGGFVGVDVFFVISAYLITSILADGISRGRFSLLRFYERRARRILPALTLVVLVTFAVGALVLLPAEMDDLGKSAVATTFFASNVHFALSLDYFASASELKPLLHTWSLAVEEQFYLLFPPLLYLMVRLGGQDAALRSIAFLSILSLALAVAILPIRPGWTFFLLPTRAWELGIGAALALLPSPARLAPRSRNMLAAAGLGAIALPVFLYGPATPFPGLAALPPVLGAAAILLGGRGGGSAVTRFLSTRPMVRIGLISYSLYLWHWPVLALLRSARGAAELPLPLGLAATALSVGLAALTYRLVETPFRSRPPEGISQGAVFALSAAALGLTAGLGAALALTHGAPGRLPPHVRVIAAAAEDTNPRRAACFGTLPSEGLCRLGTATEGAADFLLWGDSHALALMPAVDLAATKAGLSGLFAGQSACLPLPGLRRLPENRACTELNAAMMAFLTVHDDIRLVVLSGRWTLSVEGTRFGEEPGEAVRLARAESAGGEDNAGLVERALADTVVAIRATGREVLILGPVPEPGWDVPLRAAKSAMVFGRPLPAPVSRDAFIARAGRTEAMLDRVAATDPGITHIRLSPLFCGETCAATGPGGIPLYSDDDHLTVSAARRLLPLPLTRALVQAIP
ncbi:acyltransferase family protein [Tropicimonas sp. IMCC6043]|uniref:acyltransferase family protein n=1 Tax=Tropicimonas sp. IMCC6043 TaxID=2510645 RepID=UPI0013EE1658|nr:acyltransferase family protein [Tropicimonas sp. IMCC6043]